MSRRPFDREQAWLLPPELGELVPADHPARFVAEFVDTLRPGLARGFGIGPGAGEGIGAPAYEPRALLAVCVYGFMIGVRSSRKLETACREQVPFLWLSGRQCPDHNTLWRFYNRHRLRMRDLLKTTVHTAVKLGLVDLALQAVDGTKIEGNASRFRVMDAESLRRLLIRTEEAIRDLEAQNESGDDPPPPSLPEELKQAETLRERLRAAWASLEESGQERVNVTDPDVRPMKGNRGPVCGYNAQAVAAPLLSEEGTGGQIIIAAEVVTDANDAYQLAPMMAQAEEMTGEQAPITLADAGYHSGEALAACVDEEHQVVMPESQDRALNHPYHKDAFSYDSETDTFTCPQGQPLTFRGMTRARNTPMRRYRADPHTCRGCPAFGVCTKSWRHGRTLEVGPHERELRAHRAWMASEEAQRWKRRRSCLIEPVFSVVKEQMDGRRFLVRGLEKVRAEWAMLATAFNLRALHRAWAATT